MEISSTFIPMEVAQQRLKYVSSRTPIAMFTTLNGNVDMGVNMASSRWGSADLDILHDFYKAGILNLYDQVTFHQDTIREINGRPFIVFEFLGSVAGDDNSFSNAASLTKYIYIQYTLYHDSVLLFNFSAPELLQREWKETATEMMESIKIK